MKTLTERGREIMDQLETGLADKVTNSLAELDTDLPSIITDYAFGAVTLSFISIIFIGKISSSISHVYRECSVCRALVGKIRWAFSSAVGETSQKPICAFYLDELSHTGMP